MALVLLPGLTNLIDDISEEKKLPPQVVEAALREALTEAYVLEISSPGIGDRLQSDRDFQTFRSYPVDVVYTDGDGHEQRQSGTLLERTADHVQINMRGRVKRIPRDSVISVELTSPTG